ncbi:MAG: cation:proton antiporter subunit C, partial [Anaerolineae bacterium]|nr:cation:proton antiporter subunit C [Anaerolineae bacterium]
MRRSASGIGLFCIGLYGFFVASHIVRKLLAMNVMGVGVFMLFIANALNPNGVVDPVPHALVLTGIVVAVAGTALGLSLVCRIHALNSNPQTGKQTDGCRMGMHQRCCPALVGIPLCAAILTTALSGHHLRAGISILFASVQL